jgi:transcriptional regulator with XRE-family HTH domain
MRDMATTGKTPAATARPKRATTKKPPKFAPRADGEPTAAELLAARVALAVDNPDQPLMAIYRPTPVPAKWVTNLKFLIDRGNVPTDAILKRTKIGRSTLYSWTQGRRGDRPSQRTLDLLAKDFGIPREAWLWDLKTLKAWLEDTYPEYRYEFGTSASSEESPWTMGSMAA